MALFALADTHLSISTDKPMDIFGRRWENWDKKLISAWLETVTDEDTVVIPGDISWGISLEEAKEDLLLLNSLPGKKLIGYGNHDYWWSTASKINAFFEEYGITTVELFYNNAFAVGETVICGTRGWYTDEKTAQSAKIKADYDKIVNRETVRLQLSIAEANKLIAASPTPLTPIAFFHFPPVFEHYVCRPILDILHANGIKQCYFGHIHGQYNTPPETVFEGITFSIISADYLNFRPKEIKIVNEELISHKNS